MSASLCPPWCDRDRCREHDPRDRFHERNGGILPAIQRIRLRGGGDELLVTAEACEIGVSAFTNVTRADETWISIDLGKHGPGITLTVESMHRLHQWLIELLAAL